MASANEGNQTRHEVSETRSVKPKISRRPPSAGADPAKVAVKNYILDTNVLLHDPNSILNFEENCVLIPIEVIEEIDRFKRESSELGQNARTVSRTLDNLREKGHLNKGVKLSNGGKLRIIFHDGEPLMNGNGHGN